MTDHNVETFIESMLADRAPKAFTAATEDVQVLGIAVEIRALQGGAAPDPQFVETLHRSLAGTTQAGATLLPFPAGVWRRDDTEATTASVASSRHPRRNAPRRLRAAGKAAAAAVLIAGTFSAANLLSSHGPAARTTHVASVYAVHSAELISLNGRHLGQTSVYSANPSWVFVDVQHSGLAGIYMCRLHLVDGTDVTAGTLNVDHGSGEWAHTVDVDVSQLRTAALETPAGEVVATATFS
jgi:hypothetical protein